MIKYLKMRNLINNNKRVYVFRYEKRTEVD